MTDLLTPEKVREIQERQRRALSRDYLVPRLCRDYLTLWDRNKELEAVLRNSLVGGLDELKRAVRDA